MSACAKLIIENLGFPSVLAGKAIVILGVAAGSAGAIKSLEQLRCVLSHIGAIVLPGPVSIAMWITSSVRTGYAGIRQSKKDCVNWCTF